MTYLDFERPSQGQACGPLQISKDGQVWVPEVVVFRVLDARKQNLQPPLTVNVLVRQSDGLVVLSYGAAAYVFGVLDNRQRGRFLAAKLLVGLPPEERPPATNGSGLGVLTLDSVKATYWAKEHGWKDETIQAIVRAYNEGGEPPQWTMPNKWKNAGFKRSRRKTGPGPQRIRGEQPLFKLNGNDAESRIPTGAGNHLVP